LKAYFFNNTFTHHKINLLPVAHQNGVYFGFWVQFFTSSFFNSICTVSTLVDEPIFKRQSPKTRKNPSSSIMKKQHLKKKLLLTLVSGQGRYGI